jgi:hypothetical protein
MLATGQDSSTSPCRPKTRDEVVLEALAELATA